MRGDRFVIVALVPEPWATDVNNLRREYDQWSRQWLPPHITIVPPFSGELGEHTIRDLEAFEANIPVNLQGWGAFHHERSNVLWLEAGEKGTHDIRRRLTEVLPDLATMFTHPAIDWNGPASHHVTVANRIPHDTFGKVESELKKIDLSGEFTIPRLTVFRWDAMTGRWLFANPGNSK